MAARWQRKGRQGKTPRAIVIHCTVSPEMGTGAESVARYFETSARPGSTHKVSDNNSTVRCVEDADTAYGAAGLNNDGLHLELVGQPDQTAAQWLDAYSTAELHEAGPTIREWSAKYTIPLRWMTVAEVRGTGRGLCTHADASEAFPAVSTGHWDPGPNFSKAEALRIWRADPTPPPLEVIDMAAQPRIFITSPSTTSWFLYDGFVKRALAYGENQTMLDMSLVEIATVKEISDEQLAAIPDA